MIKVQVPGNHPLEQAKNAIQVFMVLDLDDEVHGVYFNEDRAFNYIQEFYLPERKNKVLKLVGYDDKFGYKVYDGDKHIYNIVPTYLRH